MSSRNFYSTFLTIATVACLFEEPVLVSGCDARDKLVRDLTKHYLTSVEPDGAVLKAGMALTCSRYDSTTRVLTSSVWEKYSWTDQRLRWNPKDYAGIETIRLPSSLIWLPDFKVYNSLIPVEERDSTITVVGHKGNVIWIPTALYKTPCLDASTGLACKITVGSWVYDADTLKLELDGSGIDLDNYQNDTCPLTVRSASAVIRTKHYPCCEEPYSSIEYSIDYE